VYIVYLLEKSIFILIPTYMDTALHVAIAQIGTRIFCAFVNGSVKFKFKI